ncbi:MAG: thiamine biosynthesis lipoprotein [Patiriisocius sp.]
MLATLILIAVKIQKVNCSSKRYPNTCYFCKKDNLLKIITSLTCLAVLLISCNASTEQNNILKKDLVTITGKEQGTTFTIKYHSDDALDYTSEIGTIFKDIDQSMSLWVPNSEINKLNNDTLSSIIISDPNDYFKNVFTDAKSVYKKTIGIFDPSILKLINAYGFGAKDKNKLDDGQSLTNILDDENLFSFKDSLVFLSTTNSYGLLLNKRANTALDFNAIAQGYTVDELARFMDEKNIENYYIEVGGELTAKGKNTQGNFWTVGIDRPQGGPRTYEHIVMVKNESLATSGSYRKFIEKDGKKYSHAINPITRRPVDHNLLSVTVKMKSCSMADAYATAFLVMGKDETIKFLIQNEDLGIGVFLIFEENGNLKYYNSENFEVKAL